MGSWEGGLTSARRNYSLYLAWGHPQNGPSAKIGNQHENFD